MIGEDAKNTAKFIKHVTTRYSITNGFNGADDKEDSQAPTTKAWSRTEILELIKGLAYRLQWDASFLRQLMLDFSQIVITSPTRLADMHEEIRFKFATQKPVQAFEYFPPGASSSPVSQSPIASKYQSMQEQVNFSIQVLDMILLEAECQQLSLILKDLKSLGMAWENVDKNLDEFLFGTTAKFSNGKSDSKCGLDSDIEE